MIVHFRHRGLKRFAESGDRSRLPPDLIDRIQTILTVLESAAEPAALDLPTFRLHPLKGQLQGFWAVTVRANWRIIFRFEDGNANDVDFIDYH